MLSIRKVINLSLTIRPLGSPPKNSYNFIGKKNYVGGAFSAKAFAAYFGDRSNCFRVS